MFSKQFVANSTVKTNEKLFAIQLHSINYSHVEQNGGYGKVFINLTLPRDPVRGMKIYIEGDISGMSIPKVNPLCSYQYTSRPILNQTDLETLKFGIPKIDLLQAGNFLVDSCNLGNLSDNSGKNNIILYNKWMIYKCGMQKSLNRNVLLNIWPVKIMDFSNPNNFSKNFKINAKLLSGKHVTLKSSNGYSIQNSGKSLATDPILGSSEKSISLCPVTKIDPKVVDEYASYEFSFYVNYSYFRSADYDKNKAPNELTLFLTSLSVSDPNNANLACYYKGEPQNCNFKESGVLNINLSTPLDVNTAVLQKVTVAGLKNKYIDSSNTEEIACSINYFDLTLRKRVNYIVGQGKIQDQPTIYKTVIAGNQGNLRFINTAKSPISTSPREISSYTINITPDTTLGQIRFPLTISNNPRLIITFPGIYKLDKKKITVPIAVKISEYVSNSAGATVLSDSQPIINAITQVGSQIKVTLIDSSRTIPINFLYWEIIITNLPNPQDKVTASGISVLITNSDYSIILRTYTNLYSYVGDSNNPIAKVIEAPKLANNEAENSSVSSGTNSKIESQIYPFINYLRGVSYDFTTTKRVIDVQDLLKKLDKNHILLSPGRFMKYTFVLRKNKKLTSVDITDITLDSTSMAKFTQPKYTVTSTIKHPLPFIIGVSCNTAKGNYILNFNSSNTKTYYPMSIINLIIQDLKKGTITLWSNSHFAEENGGQIQDKLSVAPGGSVYIYYKLSEQSYDDLIMKWTAGKKNDKDSTITEETIPSEKTKFVAKYSSKNLNQTTTDEYTAVNPNYCYEVQPISKITGIMNIKINMLGKLTNITDPATPYNLTESFEYFNADTKPQLLLTSMDSLMFTFTPPLSMIFLNCGLVCKEREYPADNVLLNPTEQIKLTVDETLLSFYNTIILDTKKLDIWFNNLIRGREYKLKCFISATNTVQAKNLTYSKSIVYDTFSNKIITNQIMKVKDVIMPKCIHVYHTLTPGITQEDINRFNAHFLGTFQNHYLTSGFEANGCIVVLEDITQETSFGLNIPVYPICKATKVTPAVMMNTLLSPTQKLLATKKHVPQFFNSISSSNKTGLFKYCAYQLKGCATDPYIDSATYDIILNNFYLTISTLYTESTISKIFLLDDKITPNINLFKLSNMKISAKNILQFKTSYITPVKCRFSFNQQIATVAPSRDEIKKCTLADSLCGEFETNSQGSKHKVDLAGVKPLLYYVWVYCVNDVPIPTKPSAVNFYQNFTAFNYVKPIISTNSTNATGIIRNNTNATTTGMVGMMTTTGVNVMTLPGTTSASYMVVKMVMMVSVWIVLMM